MTHHDVAIIGAGLSGLSTAYRLMQQGFNVHLYEARPRVGGRVFTALLHDVPVELGAQNILDGGEAENIFNLIDDLGLSTVEGRIQAQFHYENGTDLVHIDDALINSEIICSEEALREKVLKIASTSKNMEDVLRVLFANHPELYKLFSLRLMGYEGIHVERLSTHYIESLIGMLLQTAQQDRYLDYKFVSGGNGRLVEKLKEKLGERITAEAPLKTLSKLPASYELQFSTGQTVTANKVVLALPCSTYKDIVFEGETNLQSRLKDIQAVAYGAHAKVQVPLYIPENVYGLYANDRFATFSMGTPNIVTMYYLNQHVSFAPTSLKQVFHRDHKFLKRIYGDTSLSETSPSYAKENQFVKYDVPVGYNWFEEPYSQGSYSCIAAGQEKHLTTLGSYQGEQVKALFAPIDKKLFFTGEHTTILTDVLGTMEAAVEAGERTARMVAS